MHVLGSLCSSWVPYGFLLDFVAICPSHFPPPHCPPTPSPFNPHQRNILQGTVVNRDPQFDNVHRVREYSVPSGMFLSSPSVKPQGSKHKGRLKDCKNQR